MVIVVIMGMLIGIIVLNIIAIILLCILYTKGDWKNGKNNNWTALDNLDSLDKPTDYWILSDITKSKKER